MQLSLPTVLSVSLLVLISTTSASPIFPPLPSDLQPSNTKAFDVRSPVQPRSPANTVVNPDAITGTTCDDPNVSLVTHDTNVALLSICGGIAGAIQFCGGDPSTTVGASGTSKFTLTAVNAGNGATINVSKGRWEGSPQQLVEDENVYTKETPGRGNGLYVARDTAAKSQLVFVAQPLLVALETTKLATSCYYCFRSPSESDWQASDEPKGNLKTCSRCKVVRFCDQKCQTQAWSQYHRLECKLYSKLYPRILPSSVRAIIRLLKQHKEGMLLEGEWEHLLKLESHQEEIAKAGGQRWQDLIIMMQGIKGYSGTDQSPELILRLICILTVNSFTLTNVTFDSIGLVLHPKPALVNHSCDPNAYVRFDIFSPSHQPGDQASGSLSVHALRDIGKDEEITISYVDTTFPLERRRQELRERYFFSCQCDLCARGQDTPQDTCHFSPSSSLQLASRPTVVESGQEAEQFFLSMQANAGLEQEHVDSIRTAMNQLAKTGVWPVYRYPWPQLRQQLLYGLLGLGRFPQALFQSAVFVRAIHPILFKQEWHPIRLVQIWMFWNLSRHCLETLMEKEGPSDQDGHDIRILGLLSCVLIDHVRQIMSGKERPVGRLERMVDRALGNVQQEGPFWSEYWRNQAKTRKAAWAWVDAQVEGLLKGEGVPQELIEETLSRAQG
ncbi:hypothetical protein A1O1_00777 [Capronia coronata CBS 617.96]|uniref:Uncharacterized protein n=1 Tax=Capronia coronata CBS 617.96 TaxID=1182541 RepID=W9Z123_9EURO|nr:uncharacterized protein A1O1_00777 [Capronia coronata CBS 617.96]EXJ95655.1 hypothetical protein A1O1_00777 [Capronia coronata CBS 617.96]